MELAFSSEREPLAARMRPRTLDEFVGQDHIVGPGRLLRRSIEADQLQSIILSGPPGTGKTTLARIIAECTQSRFHSISAVLSGVKDIRSAIATAREFSERTNRRMLLFVDEVHRWNKSQQDALLPWVENGVVTLIGATTENPFFEVNKALLSRSRVFLLKPLREADLHRIMEHTLSDRERGYGQYSVTVTAEAREHLVSTAAGDARTLLNALQLAVETSEGSYPPPREAEIVVTRETAEDSIQRRAVLYDKDGDYHYDTISAFIKSIRGSDPDAALYWLARMITAGEDPHYIFRRLLILASEDIGLADPDAISRTNACAVAFDRIGLPEGQYHLAQATLYCALAAKSNSTMGYFDALQTVQKTYDDEVPTHLRDPSRDGPDLAHGRDYLYPHAYQEHWVAQRYLPRSLHGRVFFRPGNSGWEKERREEIELRRTHQLALEQEDAADVFVFSPSRDGGGSGTVPDETGPTEAARSLIEWTVDQLALSSTDRVLLSGTPVHLFLRDVVHRSSGGITSIWSPDIEEIHTIDHFLKQWTLPAIEQPQVVQMRVPGDLPEKDDFYRGPFDRVLYRDAPGTYTASGDLLPWISSIASDLARLVILEVLPEEGTVPSDVLDLPERLRAAVKRAESTLFSSRTEPHQELPDSSGTWTRTHVETRETTLTRLISGGITRSWVAPGALLGDALRTTAGEETLSEIRAAVETQQQQEIAWKRVYRAHTLVRSRLDA